MALLAARGLAALGAGPQAGFVARGSAAIVGVRGTSAGAATVESWGAGHCRLTVDIDPPGSGGHFELIAKGMGLHRSGPAAWAEALPLGFTRFAGCALLPQGLPWAEAAAGTVVMAEGAAPATLELHRVSRPAQILTLTLDPSTGLPSQATWQESSPVTVTYGAYAQSGGFSFPTSVVVTSSLGSLTLRLESIQAHADFTDGDFPAPAPKPLRHPRGGRP